MLRWFETRLEAFPPEPPVQPPGTLWDFYRHFIQPVWPAFAFLLVVGLLGSLIEVALFAFLGRLIDLMKEAASPAAFFADNAWTLGLMAFVTLVARPLFSVLHDVTKNQVIAGPLTARIRWQTHRWVLGQSMGFYQNDFAGRIANKIMQTGPALRETVVQAVDGLWYVAVYWIGALVLFLDADWRLTLPLIVWLAAYVGAVTWFVPRIKQRSTEASEARSMLMGRIVDSYTNILTVKLFAHTDREESYAREGMLEQMERWQASLRLITGLELTLYLMNGVLIVATTGVALWLWSEGAVSIGAIALASGLAIRIVNMSGWVLMMIAGIFENMGVVQEGMDTIARPHTLVDVPGAAALAVRGGEIRFEGVRFHYGQPLVQRRARSGPPARPPDVREGEAPPPVLRNGGVIDDLTLTIRAGEKVGLVGRSGAGKSTLVNLLMRFWDLEGGRILVDGQDIARVTQESLRSQIGLVTQDTSLLHRSIRDNILYGRPDAGEAAMRDAARKAVAEDFIPGLFDLKGRRGYDAHVGERGVKLSGGQRQRIAIARVLLKNAPILLLDEATSALDSEAEAAIQEQLFNLMEGKTVIAIAHRLSTISAMDRLVVMDKGHIVEEGPHAVLLAKGGLYADLWARQSGGFLARDGDEEAAPSPDTTPFTPVAE
jgi:ATP-binding cassette subfamily B multidrug efflux pump